ncbi:MAG: FAD/NAD(P)-binding protein [Candidatus Eremiobacteraeota bacterium]|nr:FAD/NAD(P)-binding protein [Candidatus Eremiobacteraeota bacterium]
MIRLDVAVIGGGFCGCAVAAHLSRSASGHVALALFEPDELGRGAAYGSRHAEHLLNTRAGAMSMFADDPQHFVRWLGPRGSPTDFVSRRLYGEYVGDVARPLFGRGRFTLVREAVGHVRPYGAGFVVTSNGGTQFAADRVVLATGNPPPNDDFLPAEVRIHPGYVGNPWNFDFRTVGGHVLVLGSGLSALDVIGALGASGHRGRISVLSRRGHYPEVHAEVLPYDLIVALDTHDARALLRSFRAHVRTAQRRGFDWRAVVDALRNDSETLWRRLPPAEQRRFDRHLRSRWDRRRHRAPAEVDAVRAAYEREGRLATYAGRLQGFVAGEATIALRDGSSATLHPDWIVNCTGVGKAAMLARDPLIRQLLEDGLVAADSHGVGLRVDGTLSALASDGAPVERLKVLGSLVRGCRFEATAVPELRVMAADVATRISAQLRCAEGTAASSTAEKRENLVAAASWAATL